MRDREQIKAYFVMTVIALGTLLSILMRAEYWPFCYYPMFREIPIQKQTTNREFRGVTVDGKEISLVDPAYFYPIQFTRLKSSARMAEDAGPQDRQLILKFFFQRYEQLREEGRHDGPQLTELRLYVHTWTVVSGAANRKAPDSSTMVGTWRPGR